MSDSLTEKLRERISRRDAMLVPGCPNALTARIAEDLGFEAAYVTGAGVTNMYLGMPDLSFLSLYVPASPDFDLKVEVKSVVTVVAKVHHYWQAHTRSRLQQRRSFSFESRALSCGLRASLKARLPSPAGPPAG